MVDTELLTLKLLREVGVSIKNQTQLKVHKSYYIKSSIFELIGISEDVIDVEFIILKRKVEVREDIPTHRISKHIPANGKVSVNKA